MRLNSFRCAGLLYNRAGWVVDALSCASGAFIKNINDNEAKSALNIAIFSYGEFIKSL